MRLSLVILSLMLSSCSGGGGGSSGNFIPVIQVECATGSLATCNTSGKTAYVGIIETLTLDCDDSMAGLNASQRQQLFTASGQTIPSVSGAYLIGRVSSWVNSTGGQQDVLNPGTYQVCAFVDLNSNGAIDTNEPVARGQFSTGGSGTYILNSWAAAFN